MPEHLDTLILVAGVKPALVEKYTVVSAVGRIPNPVTDFLWQVAAGGVEKCLLIIDPCGGK